MRYKDFLNGIKRLGYKYKSHLSGYYNPIRCLEVLDLENNFIVGSGGNVYSSDHINKHKAIFEYLQQYRNKIFDNSGVKVVF